MLFQVPYKIKEVELDYDNYNQVPESPIGRDEEPHLYMVPKKFRKVCIILFTLPQYYEPVLTNAGMKKILHTSFLFIYQVTIKYSKLGLEDFDFTH